MNLGTARPPKRKSGFEEDVNEPAKLVDEDAVEVEGDTPAQPNEPVEAVDDGTHPDAPAFEE